MTNEVSLWDVLLGIFGINSDSPEDEVGVEWVPNG